MNWMQGMAIGFVLGALYIIFVHPWLDKKINGRKQ
jgi:hypothetical protein